ncbi:hypothetical protein CAPTEDRAFT_227321 [Capitella teleta]|uniref:KY-like immunoglobulin-like domain-containing protein n=1 Tax=Capitella teleta TaxID=283909 RepID=R7V9H0_CAPTE|nr:hypothetical protein CAPTEDRAFT_227321 [Capitella teleta]|eukprot:ELU12390.1 hypothetical protein CAPTEDRAFT_227321 [Capitella teleta]
MGCGSSLANGSSSGERNLYMESEPATSALPVTQLPDTRRKRRSTGQGRWGGEIQTPVIPKICKGELFDPKQFVHLDHYVTREYISKDVMQGSYEGLATQLTKTAHSELEKAWVLFRWLSGVNLQHLVQEAGNELPPQDSPVQGLLEIHWRLSNHAHFFARLARAVGLDCEIISGINKNAHYQVGQTLAEDLLGAQWNAINIFGETRLLDVFWASTCVDDSEATDWMYLWDMFKDSDDNIDSAEIDKPTMTKHQINDFFFLTDPEKFIVTHFPEEQKWQLLQTPITVDEFSNQVYIRERFYEMNLSLGPGTPDTCVLTATDGQVTFSMTAPMEDISAMLFRWKLTQMDGQQSGGGVTYDRYVFFQKKGALVEFWIVLPKSGNFLFDLYGQLGSGEHYGRVCTFLIAADAASENAEPLPDLPDAGWGMCPVATQHQLTPRFEAIPYIEADDGLLDLAFTVPEGKIVGNTLRHNVIEDVVLKRHSVITKKDETVTVQIRFPCKGSFALGIYIGDQDHNEMYNAANFMINCASTGITPRPYPMLHTGFLGEDLMAQVMGVRADSHSDDFVIKTKEGDLQVNFKIKNPSAVDLLCELQNNDIDSAKLSGYITMSSEGAWTTFDLQLPAQGEYGFNVFARKMGVDYQIFHVFSYLVVAEAGTGSPIKIPEDAVHMETIFTADDIADIRVAEKKGLLLSVAKKNSQNRNLLENQVSAKKEGDINVYEVNLPTVGEYVAVVYKLKNGHLVTQQVTQLVRLEPLQGDQRSMAMMFPDRRLNKTERKKRKSMALGLNHEAFRLQLMAAVASQNVSLLQWAIGQCEANYVHEKNGELRKSKKILDFLLITQELGIAVQSRDLTKLKLCMESAKKKGFSKMLSLKIIAELQRYDAPPDVLVAVLVATCDLLGLDGNQLQVQRCTHFMDWELLLTVLKQKGKRSLKKMVLACNIDTVDIVSAVRTKHSLQSISLDDVKMKSSSAALFYLWCMAVAQEVESRFVHRGGDLRQAKILAKRSALFRRSSSSVSDDKLPVQEKRPGFTLPPITENGGYRLKLKADPGLAEL